MITNATTENRTNYTKAVEQCQYRMLMLYDGQEPNVKAAIDDFICTASGADPQGARVLLRRLKQLEAAYESVGGAVESFTKEVFGVYGELEAWAKTFGFDTSEIRA